jgi:hypothetical protein
VRALAQQLGGKLEVGSTSGKFCVEIPSTKLTGANIKARAPRSPAALLH